MLVIFYVCKIWVQHDQGGAIGLAFRFFDGFFFVVRVFGVVIELGVVRTYARMSKVSLPARTIAIKTQQSSKHLLEINFDLSKLGMVA